MKKALAEEEKTLSSHEKINNMQAGRRRLSYSERSMSRTILSIAAALLCASIVIAPTRQLHELGYATPIDAISLGFETKDAVAAVRGLTDQGWTPWMDAAVEDEQDPALLESNLLLFPAPVHRVQVRGTSAFDPHPIRVARDGVRYDVAATTYVPEPSILTRSNWGADESLRYADATTQPPNGGAPTTAPDEAGEPSEREKNCAAAQEAYPAEFRTSRTVTTEGGKPLRWPLQYSPTVRLIVVHHTAQNLAGDTRSGVERMRALYTYHTVNRGWGDIGYHYVIGDDGRIYEGKAGGHAVVGGHVYCNNVGTIGIALMGNFDLDPPTQVQVQSLQWLIGQLTTTYDIDINDDFAFHGTTRHPVVGHKDLLSTDCPGHFLHGVLSQIREHVRTADWTGTVRFPAPLSSSSRSRSSSTRSRGSTSSTSPAPQRGDEDMVVPLGETTVSGRPGQMFDFSVQYTAGKSYRTGMRIADVDIADSNLKLWQERGGRMIRMYSALILPMDLRSGQTARLQLRLQAPDDAGTFTFRLGTATYTLRTEGRRLSGITQYAPSSRSSSAAAAAPRSALLPHTYVRPSTRTSSASASSRAAASLPATYVPRTGPSLPSAMFRVRLLVSGNSATLTVPKGTMVDTTASDGTAITLTKDGNHCSADQGGRNLAFGVLRFDPGSSLSTLSHGTTTRRYRGLIECRVYDDALVIINELPLEDYMAGIGEEPDTEPYEKQRAFAIAARSYAVYYMHADHRKFPGAPYDGSDSPAEFQLYVGADVERSNPGWVRAVRDTAYIVAAIDDEVLRLPYFSSDDGRTRSPAEVGWKSFPHAHVYASKPDPWCEGMTLRGHGVGMSGCGAEAQANEGKTAEEILAYYYPGMTLQSLRR